MKDKNNELLDRIISTDEHQKLEKRIVELEQQIADLKENAIIPKFRIGETVWLVYTKDQRSPIKVTIGYFRGDSLGGVFYSINDDSENYYTSAEKQLYATEAEAQIALDKLNKE